MAVATATRPAGQMDWCSVARAVLDGERRPALVLDADDVVQFTNQSFASLMGWSTVDLTGRAFGECFMSGTRLASLAALRAPNRDAKTLATLACVTKQGEGMSLLVEATSDGRPGFGWLLVVVLDARPEVPQKLPIQGGEAYYEVAYPSREGWDHRLLHTWSNRGWSQASAEARCYLVLHGRSSPCPECPVARLTLEPRQETAIAARPGSPLILEIRRASVTAHGTVVVTAFPIDAPLLSALLQRKIASEARHRGLSERERAVLDLLLLGRSMADIGTALQISPRTVKYHQRKIQDKLGAESRYDLARLFL